MQVKWGGGALSYKDPFRLVHVSTGQYLTVYDLLFFIKTNIHI
jgi:hypothetical protein